MIGILAVSGLLTGGWLSHGHTNSSGEEPPDALGQAHPCCAMANPCRLGRRVVSHCSGDTVFTEADLVAVDAGSFSIRGGRNLDIKRGRMRALLIVVLLLACRAVVASPCDSMRRDLSESEKADWEDAIAEQLNVPKVSVHQTFTSNGWTFVYVEALNSDSPFLFFHGAPDSTHFVTLWSGGARADEETSIRDWATKSVSGIPHDLAQCFAWHVTKDRDL